MAFTTCSVPTNNISTLDNKPNAVGGLTAAQLKAKFDKFGADFVQWFNETHIPELPVIATGTFTPIIKGNIVAGTNTYSVQAGTYVKIGGTVFFHLTVTLSAKDAAMQGSIVIEPLPFTSKIIHESMHYWGVVEYENINLDPGANSHLVARVYRGTGQINLMSCGDNSGEQVIDAIAITSATSIAISGFYEV